MNEQQAQDPLGVLIVGAGVLALIGAIALVCGYLMRDDDPLDPEQ